MKLWDFSFFKVNQGLYETGEWRKHQSAPLQALGSPTYECPFSQQPGPSAPALPPEPIAHVTIVRKGQPFLSYPATPG